MVVDRDIDGRFAPLGRKMTEEEKRNDPSLFQQGSDPRREGEKKRLPAGVKELLREATPEAAEKLISLVHSDNERIALYACTAILDRVFGKPGMAVHVEHSGDGTDEIRSMIRELILNKPRTISAALEEPRAVEVTQ